MSQMNRNVNYLHTVDGITVWERLRVIRNFMTDRKQAIAMTELNIKRTKANIEKLRNTPEDFTEKQTHKIEDAEIMLPQSESNLEDAKREVAFLTELEEKLKVEAEKTRIEGKTDEEMYEINYFEELIQIHLLTVKSELTTLGSLTPQTMVTLIKNRSVLDRAITMGFVNPDIKQLIGKGDDEVNVITNNTVINILN